MTLTYVKQVLAVFPNWQAMKVSQKKKCEVCGNPLPRVFPEWQYTDYICDGCLLKAQKERSEVK